MKLNELAAEKIDIYAKQIDEAFCNSDDNKLKVNIGYNIFMSKETQGGLDIEATISFVEAKINDKTISTVVENQLDLPLAGKIYPLNDARMGE